jgi:hypothetical protein
MILALSLCSDGKSEVRPGSRAHQLVGKLARGRAERPIPPADQRYRWMRLGRLGLVHPDRSRHAYRHSADGGGEGAPGRAALASRTGVATCGVAERAGRVSHIVEVWGVSTTTTRTQQGEPR